MSGERFAGKVTLVTGGSSGIGAAAVRRLAAEGATVVFAGRREPEGAALAADVPRTRFVRADVTVEDDVRQLLDDVVIGHGRLDAVFVNAGSTLAGGPIATLDTSAWHREINTNLTSVFLTLKHAIAAMSSGAILVNTSIAAVSGSPGLAAYTAAKHGALGLVRAAALETAASGLRVNALVTGNTDTPLYRQLSGVGPEADLPAAPNPTGRVASPDEIAGFVAYLLSDEAAFITGAALTMDGGFTAS